MLWLAFGIISAILIVVVFTRRGHDNLPPGPKGLPLLGKCVFFVSVRFSVQPV